ncbi:hypothetical protein Tco_0323876 [Tanacetum coccineum]
MADHSQKWHDGSTRKNIGSSSSKDGLAALVNKLDNLGRDIKKLKESVHAIEDHLDTTPRLIIIHHMLRGGKAKKNYWLSIKRNLLKEVLRWRYGSCQVEDSVWSKRYSEWCNENSQDKKPRPRDYTFKEWVKLKKGHLDISKSVRKDLFRLWVIDKSTEALDPDKDPFGRCLD